MAVVARRQLAVGQVPYLAQFGPATGEDDGIAAVG